VQSFRRRLFASISVLSLILSLATVGLWARSYWRSDQVAQVVRNASEMRQSVTLSETGYVIITHFTAAPTHFPDTQSGWAYYNVDAHRDVRLKYGFFFRRDSFAIQLAHWMFALLFALAPVWWVIGPYRRQSKRRKLGLCLTCGYDLRASPERCPECGCVAAMRTAEARPLA
jgi:hypothetical protein